MIPAVWWSNDLLLTSVASLLSWLVRRTGIARSQVIQNPLKTSIFRASQRKEDRSFTWISYPQFNIWFIWYIISFVKTENGIYEQRLI